MGMKYTSAREGVTPVAGDVLLAHTSGLEEIGKLGRVTVTGEATASAAVNRMAIRRSTTNGATPTAQTPAKNSPTSPAAYLAVATTFGTQPTTAAAPAVWTYSIQPFGGVILWVAGPDDDIFILGATAGNNEVSLESSSGTSVITCEIVHEEI